VFQAAVKSINSVGRALLAVLAMSAFSAGSANADPCAEACRSQHNACRMAAKLLFSSHCDAQLQSCITQCFSGARMREGRDGHNLREGRPPDMRGPPREFHDPREQGGQRWLGPGDRR